MILFSSNWTRLNISCEQFDGVAHGSTLPMEFAFQDGETKLRINSAKFFCDGEIHELEGDSKIPYGLQITGIESFDVSSENGHPEIYVVELELNENEFRITGMNGGLRFFGKKLAITFLRDDSSFIALEAFEQGMSDNFPTAPETPAR